MLWQMETSHVHREAELQKDRAHALAWGSKDVLTLLGQAEGT